MSKVSFQSNPITIILILLNVIVFFLPLLFGINVFSMDVEILHSLGAMHADSLILNHEIWRLLSSMFLHANFEHLFMNMVTILIIGSELERIFSKYIYLSIYFVAGIISGLVPVYFQEVGTVSVGASGAIFGIAGILVGFTLVHYEKMKEQFLDYMKGYSIFLLINLFIGFSIPEVGFTEHLTGLVVGVVGGMLLSKQKYYLLFLIFMALFAYYLYAYFLPSLYVNSTNVLF